MLRRPSLALLVALLAAVALVVSSGAVVWDSEGPVDVLTPGVENQVQMQPSSQYAYLDGGETRIDISPSNPNMMAKGVNPNSITTFRNVSALRYTGPGNATVWVTHNGTGLTIEADGQRIESAERAIKIQPEDPVGLDLIVNTTGQETISGEVTLTIHSEVPDSETGSGSSFASSQDEEEPTIKVLSPEQTVREIQIRNLKDGDQIGTDTLHLEIEESSANLTGISVTADQAGDVDLRLAGMETTTPGTVEASHPLTTIADFELTPEESFDFETVTINGEIPPAGVPSGTVLSDLDVLRQTNTGWTTVPSTMFVTEDGSVRFEIQASDTGTFVIAGPVPKVQVTTATLSRSNVTVGEPVTVTANIANNGTAPANGTATIQAENETVDKVPYTIGQGESTVISTEINLTESGNVTIAVAGLTAGEVRVTDPLALENATTGESDSQSPDQNVTSGVNEQDLDQGKETTSNEGDLVEEPAAIDLGRLGGLWLLAMLGVTLVVLIRRVSV